MATRHTHVNPTSAVIEALSRGVELNNLAHELQKAGRFDESEKSFLESLAIKLRAYPEDSVHICITLSGLADTMLEWAKATKNKQRLCQAREYAKRMRAIAIRIKSPEQRRIADEIIGDIDKAEGGTRPERDISADTDSPAIIVGGGSITIEAPTARCAYTTCSATRSGGVDLQLCGRCKRTYYCSRVCQAADWPTHKTSCQKP